MTETTPAALRVLLPIMLACVATVGVANAQLTPPARPLNPLGGSAKELARRAHFRLVCLAIQCEDWTKLYKAIGVANAIRDGRIYKRGLKRRIPGGATGARTDPDLGSGTTGDGSWTSSPGNNIATDQASWGVGLNTGNATFGAAGVGATGEATLAGALAHEHTHEDDEYDFKDGKPKTPADAKKLACEEVKGAACEIKILKAFKSGKCLTAAELAAAKPVLCKRIKDLEEFKKDQEKKCNG